MAQRLKRWESPRRSGRNHKGRGGSARQRQRKQQLQQLRKRLKSDPTSTPSQSSPTPNPVPPREASASLFLWASLKFFHRPRPWDRRFVIGPLRTTLLEQPLSIKPLHGCCCLDRSLLQPHPLGFPPLLAVPLKGKHEPLVLNSSCI